MGGIEYKLWCNVRDKVMRCVDRTTVSPRGRGFVALVAYMEENAENTMPISEPWWYMENRHHEWTPGQYRRCLTMRMCRQRCEASLSAAEWAVGALSGNASADNEQADQEEEDENEGEEGDDDVVVLDGEENEEQHTEQPDADDNEESIEEVEEEEEEDEEEDEEDERTLRRKRRAQSRNDSNNKPKSTIQKHRKPPRKRRAVVEDYEDDEDQDDQDLHEHVNAQSGGGPSTHHKLPDSVRRMRFYRVEDASKTHVYVVPGTNLVGIIEHF